MRYYECGVCGHYHRENFYGDCRQDDERLTIEDVENEAGLDWAEITMEEAAQLNSLPR